jgi:hypothetical protein
MPEITEQSRVPFGRLEKGKRLCDCSDSFLQWIVEHLTDSDHHLYAFHAKGILTARSKDEKTVAVESSLEAQADALLRNAGCGHLCTRHRRQAGSMRR